MTDPRKLVLKRKPDPGLTGADLEQAKAEAALAASAKGYGSATAQRAYDRTGPLATESADAAANLKNIAYARNPQGANALERALDDLRRRMRR